MILMPHSIVQSRSVSIRRTALRLPAFPTAVLALLALLLPLSGPAQIAPCLSIECPEDIIIACAGRSGAVVAFTPVVQNNCRTVATVTCTPPSGSEFPLGTNTVTCIAVDTLRNAARCTFKVIVLGDTISPTMTVPESFGMDCNTNGGAYVTFDATAVDNCDGVVNVACTPRSGSFFPIGTNRVICRTTDRSGNLASKSFNITVRDSEPPQLTLPAIVEATCTRSAGAIVTFGVTVIDNCDTNPAVVCQPPSGSLFPLGTTMVSCVATDESGNSTNGTFLVQVTGTCDPNCLDIQCPSGVEVALRSGAKQAVRFKVTATNQCTGAAVDVHCEPPSGSLFRLGETVVQCAAKVGNIAKRCSFTVTVRDGTPPWVMVPNDFSVECQGFGLGDGGGAAVPFQVKATDNSGLTPVVTCVPPSGSWLTLGTHPITCVATDASGNKATNSFAVTVTSGSKCQVEPVVFDLAPDNWSFELGLVGWRPQGAAFEFQPVLGSGVKVRRVASLKQQLQQEIGGDYWPDLNYRIGVKGNHWIGTADNYVIPPGELFDDVGDFDDGLTGELLSKPFVITKPFITFLIGGTEDMDHLRVELLVKTDPDEVPGPIVIGSDPFRVEHKATGHGRELMRRAAFALNGFGHHVLGRKARIRIVDNSSGGHLNVDDFQFTDLHPIGQRVMIGGKEHPAVVQLEGEYYDWDAPVWGFADLHTHPMSHLGFAEKVMHGMPDGGPADPANIALALGDCRCTHDGWKPGNECGEFLRQAMMMAMDKKGNETHREGWSSDSTGGIAGSSFEEYARFRHWPVFSTIAHQQMWYEWIKRAYNGGLRVMVALCVNNPLLASASKGDGPIDDMTVGNNQIAALKEFVARHDDFMEIALNPFELRDILRRNKLAIIIGSELDDIGNFALNDSVFEGNKDFDPGQEDRDKVRAEIDRLYDLGLRYIFPVHLMDNKFGGSPIVDPMLNMASKFLNGHAMQVVPGEPGEHISCWLPEEFDLLKEMEKYQIEISIGAALLPVLAPFLPAVIEAWGGIPLGGASGGLMPLAMMAAAGALGEFGEVIKAVPPDVWPVGNNYPKYPNPGEAPWGHKNARGLTKLGRFAVFHVMKKGMMIDVDHMSQRTIDEVFAMAEANPVGYPLNSGHNSFRDQATEHRTENHRTGEQMARIRKLGGMFGVGYENSSQYGVVNQRQFTVSYVENDCGGTSKTVSQIYLQALEAMDGHNVALGTDINGLIAGPGPRFGPNSSFGTKSPWNLEELIRGQRNGVLYEPMHGRPIVGPAFLGRGVDPGQEFGWGRDEYTDNGNLHYGYTYSQEQRDFFPAIRIFYYFKKQVSDGLSQTALETELGKIVAAMSAGYNKFRVGALASGLIKGIKGWPLINVGQDITFGAERLGRLVFQTEVLDASVPDDLDDLLLKRLASLRGVWADYHHIFGGNTPLKRSKTGLKDWDINFDGVAHYGLLPDLFQDMKNVGMEPTDLNPLFHSGEDFARMWTKTLNAADAISHPQLFLPTSPTLTDGSLHFEWFGEIGDRLEESDNLGERANWRPSSAEIQVEDYRARATVRIGPGAKGRFFRVRKP